MKKQVGTIVTLIFIALISIFAVNCGKDNGNGGGGNVLIVGAGE